MQTALDSTALMLSKEAATDTEQQLKDNALKYFTALFVRPEAQNIHVDVAYTTDGGSKIVIGANATMQGEFTKVIGHDFYLSTSSTAKWGTSRLRVALVLDNTGSMADAGKIGALQTATHGLLSQLQGAVTTAGDVYVSIIPFVKDVNLGATNWNADWVYWGTAVQDPTFSDNTSWDALHGTCSNVGLHEPKQLLHARRHLQQHDLHHAEHLLVARRLQRRRKHDAEHLQFQRDLQRLRPQ